MNILKYQELCNRSFCNEMTKKGLGLMFDYIGLNFCAKGIDLVILVLPTSIASDGLKKEAFDPFHCSSEETFALILLSAHPR